MTSPRFIDLDLGDSHGEVRSTLGKVFTFERRPGETIWDMVEEYKVPVNTLPTVCVVDGEPVLRKDWGIPLDQKSGVMFITIPNGDAFGDILAIVASIALAIVAPWAAGVIGGLLNITSQFGLALIQGGIFIAGSFLISALLPKPPTPEEQPSPSPTYSLTAQGNTVRLFQPIPKQYGEHIIYPDFAAQPYDVYENNRQILYQLFCLGLGKYSRKQVRVEETVLWDSVTGYNEDYVGLEIQFVEPGEQVTLFHSQVQTSEEVQTLDLPNWQGVDDNNTTVELTFTADGYITSPFSETFAFAIVGQKIWVPEGSVNTGVYTIIDIATDTKWIKVNDTFTPETWAGGVGLVEESQWVGGYAANTADTITNKIQVDFYLPRGLYWANDEGGLDSATVSTEVQFQVIDSAGEPLSDWITIGVHTYTMATTTPQRITETYHTADARYRIRVRRLTPEDPRSRSATTIQWSSLRAFIPNDNIYPDVTLMAVKMQVTGQLAQNAARRFNVIQTAIIPVYDADTETWSDQPTRSIAWAAYDIVNNSTYGANLLASTIDLDKLVYLDEVWTDRDDHFDGIFDSQVSCWDALTSVLRVGRTIPVLLGGLLTFERRESQTVPKGIFTPNNIVRNSFETEHILFNDESPDDIIVEFFDRRTWRRNEVQCILPDSTSEKPERQQMFGITDRTHAWREGIFAAAFNAKNRIVARFTTELEGRLLLRSNLIYVAHDLYDWGKTGEVEYYIPVDRAVYLDRNVEVTPDSYIILRNRKGKGWGPVKINQGDDLNIVVIDEEDLEAVEGSQGPIADVWSHEGDQVRTKFIIAEQVVNYKRFTVVSGTPKDNLVDLVVIYDDPSVHLADQAPNVPPSETYPYGPQQPTRPVIAVFSVTQQIGSPAGAPVIDWVWTTSVPAATTYFLEMSYDGFNWDTIYEGSGTSYSATVFPGMLYSRVRGISTILGPWKTHSGSFGTSTLVPLAPTELDVYVDIEAGTLRMEWNTGVRATSYDVEVYSESVLDSGTFDVLEFDLNTRGTTYLITSPEVLAAGGPWQNIQVKVYSVNDAGTSAAITETVTSIKLDTPENLHLLNEYISQLYVQWDAVDRAEGYRVFIEVDSVDVATFEVGVPEVLLTETQLDALGGPWASVTIRVEAFTNTVVSDQAEITVTLVEPMDWDDSDSISWDDGDFLAW
jgi:hypothetical protein